MAQDAGAAGLAASGRRWTVRRMMVAIALAAVALLVVRPVYFYFDATYRGPCTRAYDREYMALARSAGLVGKAEAEAIRVLGEPTETWEYDQPEGRTTTLAYAVSPFAGVGTFQVHCRGGIVLGVATGDD